MEQMAIAYTQSLLELEPRVEINIVFNIWNTVEISCLYKALKKLSKIRKLTSKNLNKLV